MKNKNKILFIIVGSIAVITGLLTLFFYKPPVKPVKKEKIKKAIELKEVTHLELPPLSCQKLHFIISAIDTSISILQKRDEDFFSFLDKKIKRQSFINSLRALKKDLEQGKDLSSSLRHSFQVFEVVHKDKKDALLVTGYYQPEFFASNSKDQTFKVPVLATPNDLIYARLKDFDGTLPPITLWGRLEDQRFLPYFDREEIERRLAERPEIYPVLCWFKSPVDLLELQIQGSGIVHLDQDARFIHYAASNGRAYTSLGRLLLKKGVLPIEKLDWQSIRQWAEKNPEKFRYFLSKNKRYVFFKWEERGPLGCFGQVLVAGVSAAFDRRVVPPALPVVVDMSFPKLSNLSQGPKWLTCGNLERIGLFVMNHDTGSAIKGPFRMDLYTGTGSQAGYLAGHLKHRARMFVFIPKVGQ